MKTSLKRLIIYSLLLFLPGLAMAQSSNDSAQVLQNCIDLSEIQQYYPLNAEGTPVQVYVMQYPTSFQADLEVSKFGKGLMFMSRSEITEKDIEAYFMFRAFSITQNTARVNLNYFYNSNHSTKQFNMVSAIIELKKEETLWSVSDIHLKDYRK